MKVEDITNFQSTAREKRKAHDIEGIRILSDGTSQGTKVFMGDTELKGVKRIEILPINVDGIVEVKLTCIFSELDLMGKLINVSQESDYSTVKDDGVNND